MNLSQICIDRPVLSTVMSLVIVLFGAIAIGRLQNQQFPGCFPTLKGGVVRREKVVQYSVTRGGKSAA